MSRPIRNTPILSERDTQSFFSEMNNLPSSKERQVERARISDSVSRLRKVFVALKRK